MSLWSHFLICPPQFDLFISNYYCIVKIDRSPHALKLPASRLHVSVLFEYKFLSCHNNNRFPLILVSQSMKRKKKVDPAKKPHHDCSKKNWWAPEIPFNDFFEQPSGYLARWAHFWVLIQTGGFASKGERPKKWNGQNVKIHWLFLKKKGKEKRRPYMIQKCGGSPYKISKNAKQKRLLKIISIFSPGFVRIQLI